MLSIDTNFSQAKGANGLRKMLTNRFVGSIFVGLLAGAVLSLGALFIDLERLHFGQYDQHLVDQVYYISAARNFAETGVLSSNVILSSTVYQNTSKNYLYMPGHYTALAASYHLFGYGIVQSYLPSLLAFVLASVCVFLIAAKVYDHRIGLLSAALFICFPPNMVYAFSAMAEMTVIFASALIFCIFIYLPPRLQPYIGPFLLAIPFVFRETTAFLVVPLALLILFGSERRNIREASIFVVATIALLGVVFTSDISAGRPSLFRANMFDDSASVIHNDAIEQMAMSPHIADWLAAILHKAQKNMFALIDAVIHLESLFDVPLVLFILFTMVGSLLYGLFRKKLFPVAAGSLTLVTLMFVITLYSFFPYRGLRVMLFTYPFLAIVLAYFLKKMISADGFVKRYFHAAFTPHILSCAVLIVLSISCFRIMQEKYSSLDYIEDENIIFLEAVGYDDGRMFLSPIVMSLGFALKHHPLSWASAPANIGTMELMAAKYNIGTAVLPRADFDSLGIARLEQMGFMLERNDTYRGEELLIFRCTRADC